MTRRRPSVLVAAAVAFVCVSAQCPADTFVPEVLFALGYGRGDTQVGVSPRRVHGDISEAAGPTGIGVAPDGSIWIADYRNGCAKRFSPYGELLAVTQPPPQDLTGRLPYDPELWHFVREGLVNLQNIAVDSEANVYTQSSGSMGLLSKFGPDGQWLWALDTIGAIPREVRGQVGMFALRGIGDDDTVYIKLLSDDPKIAILSPDGQFLGARNGYAVTPTGKTIVMQPSAADWFTRTVTVEDAQGGVLESYVADSWSGFPELFRGADYGFAWSFFDGQDCMYTVAQGYRDYRVDLAPGLSIALDTIVTRHDETGQPVAHLRMPSDPFIGGIDLTVDREGNVYHMLFGGSSMDVVKYTLKKSTEIGRREAIQELPTITRGDTRYVPLRMVADYTDKTVRWEKRTGAATVCGPSDIPGKRVALIPGEPGVIMHLDRIWVSTDVSRSRLGIPLHLDAKRRIAYYESRAPDKLTRTPQGTILVAQADAPD